MPIQANVTGQPKITASVGETKIDVKVSGGFGPSGASGAAGQAATVTVGTVTTGLPGSSAAVVNAGSSSAAVLNFTIPAGATGSAGAKGDKGDKGDTGSAGAAGSAATVTVGTVTTGSPGGSAVVTNVGSSSAAVLDFTIPQGAKGDAGNPGAKGDKGDPGDSGVAYATAPVTYDAGTKTVALSVGTGLTTTSGSLAADVGTSSSQVAAGNHGHGSLTSDGKVGTTAGQIVVTGFGGLVGTATSITPGQVVTETTYSNFLPEGGSLATALSGIDSAISGKAAAADFDQGVKTTDSPTFSSVTTTGTGYLHYLSITSAGTEQVGQVLAVFNDGGGIGSISIGDVSGFSDAASSAAPVQSVNGATGEVSLTYSDVGAAAALHAHGAITSDGKVGSTAGLVLKTGTAGAVEALAQGTAGQVLKVNSGATGVEWGAAAADVSIDTTAADILSASSGSITADDPGADRLVFWDDSAGKLTHLTVSTGLSISGTTLTASVSASDISAGTLAYARMADPTVTSPSQITANQNDYASFARGINRFTTNGAYNLTGMAAGNDGEVRILCNTGTTAANTLTIKDESSSSTAANRFYVPWNGDCVIAAEGSVVVFYDGTSSRWRVV